MSRGDADLAFRMGWAAASKEIEIAINQRARTRDDADPHDPHNDGLREAASIAEKMGRYQDGQSDRPA